MKDHHLAKRRPRMQLSRRPLAGERAYPVARRHLSALPKPLLLGKFDQHGLD